MPWKKPGVILEGDDYTEPALDSLVTVGSKIEVHRVDYQDRVETMAVPYDTEYIYTSLYFRNKNRHHHGAARRSRSADRYDP